MNIPVEDRFAITELLALHGHIFDAGQLDRMDELFTADVTYDLTDYGLTALVGIDALREQTLSVADANPVGHHVTNIVLTATDVDEVHSLSKGIGIRADGSCGSVVYEDIVSRGPDGWRISNRKVLARRAPLGRG